MPPGDAAVTRCAWAGGNPLAVAYHDAEWGLPVADPVRLFECLMLESFQSGLSWNVVLRKRETLRAAFHGFRPSEMARMDGDAVDRLMADPGVIRHRGKIMAAVAGAQAWLQVEAAEGFAELVWRSVGGTPRQNRFRSIDELPSKTAESVALAAALRRRGFRHVGPTVVYAFMQAAGLVNDHFVGCFRHGEVRRQGFAATKGMR